MRFFDKAMQANDVPEKVTMDKSGANKAAIDEINASSEIPIIVRQVKYLNNITTSSSKTIAPSNESPPDGHFKIPHLWPVKFPQAGRLNYQSFGLTDSGLLSW